MTPEALVQMSDDRMSLVYFWAAVLIAILPVAVFTTITVLLVRGYWRRREADGGGEPPVRGPGRP
jgi:hypothetical protein